MHVHFARQAQHLREKCVSLFNRMERVFAFSPSLPMVGQVLASGWRARRLQDVAQPSAGTVKTQKLAPYD